MPSADTTCLHLFLCRSPFTYFSHAHVHTPLCMCHQGHVNNQVKKSVVKALYNLPSRSPWTDAANYYAWVTPMSYLPVQRLLEETGHLSGSARLRRCTRDTSLYANIHCPEGTYKLPEVDFVSSCAEQNRSCSAAGQLCVCRPCRVLPPHPIEVFAIGHGAVNASEPCKKMHTCSSVRQRQTFSYRLVRPAAHCEGGPFPRLPSHTGRGWGEDPASRPMKALLSQPLQGGATILCGPFFALTDARACCRRAGRPHVRAAPHGLHAGRHALVVPLQVPRQGA